MLVEVLANNFVISINETCAGLLHAYDRPTEVATKTD